jgi:pimeloyl-ACP methyl ester carboxylesterase
MPSAHVGELTIEYRTHGDPTDPPIVLIRGLGTQLIEWPDELIAAFVQAGLYVVTFDNRDAGLSSSVPEGYRLEDMAHDVVGLLDALDLPQAHVFGISLGGMVAQHLAIAHAQRMHSLISVMSSPGDAPLPPPRPEIVEALADEGVTRADVIERGVKSRLLFGSAGYPEPEDVRRRAAEAAYDRAFRPEGVARQRRAFIADGSRVERLRNVHIPTLVIHGADDPLVPVAAGHATARAIPGAALVVIPGMGHNIPAALAPRIVATVVDFLELQRLL